MKIKKIAAILAAVLVLCSLSGCANRGGEESSSAPEAENRLVIYHNDPSITAALTNLVKAYNEENTRTVGVKLSGDNFMSEARDEKAALYVVNSEDDLSGWYQGEMFSDLSSDSALGSTLGDMPAGLQLSQNGLGSYGVPLMLYGCGYIFDYGMLGDLFGEGNARVLASDLSLCSYTDFEGFVEAVTTYIAAPSAATVTVNGNEYTFAAEKTGRAANLTGVFAMNYESADSEECVLSYALAAKYANSYEIMSTEAGSLSEDDGIFAAYTDVLDMHSTHISGKEGTISRGDDFAGGDYGYTSSIDFFAHSYALFYPGRTTDAADFRKSVEGYDAELGIIPIKLPIDDTGVAVGGLTAEKLQSSIVIGARYYLAVSPSADEAYTSEAKDFINWVYSKEGGQSAFSSAFGGFAFNYPGLGTGSEAPSGEGTSESGSTSDTELSGDTDTSSDVPGSAIENAGTNSGVSESANSPENSGSAKSVSTVMDSSGVSSEQGSASESENSILSTGGYTISDSLTAAVAEYYVQGRYLPMLSTALPRDWSDSVLMPQLQDFYKMENWGDSDRNDFADNLLGGWRDMISLPEESSSASDEAGSGAESAGE